MFEPDGTMRTSGKSILNTNLKFDISYREMPPSTAIVVDVSALLWTIEWNACGTVTTFIASI